MKKVARRHNLMTLAWKLAWRKQKALLRNREGGVLVEYAILLPTFLMVVFGIIEIGLVMLAQVLLDGAVIDASRGGMTGYTAAGKTRAETIADIVAYHTDFLIDSSQLQITSKSYTNFTNFGQPEPFTDSNNNTFYDAGEPYTDVNGNGQWDDDMGIAGLGGPGDVVVYEITYPWPMKTPIVGSLLAPTGVTTLRSSMMVRNQQYLTN